MRKCVSKVENGFFSEELNNELSSDIITYDRSKFGMAQFFKSSLIKLSKSQIFMKVLVPFFKSLSHIWHTKI